MDRVKAQDDKARLDDIIGKNIRKERLFRRLTRDDLAAVVDLTPSHLGLIERGERGATNVTLARISKAFGVSIDSLFVESSRPANTKAARDFPHKKILTQLSNLTDSELEFVSHTIKGMSVLREPNK